MALLVHESAACAAPPDPDIQWEETPCPLCGSRRWSTLLEAPDVNAAGGGPLFAVVRCRKCGLCFTNPRPSAASIGRFYLPTYGPYQKCAAQPPRRHGVRWRLPIPLLRRAGFPWRHALPWHGQGRLLDFGCGNGSFLQLMHLEGWRVVGLDISRAIVRRIRTELGLPALAGTLPHPKLSPASFDVITMWQSLEHVHQPLETLQQVHQLLVPGGRLLIAVPNIDSVPFRWFGSAWHGLELPRHLIHFSPPTLRQMVQRAGFAVETVRMIQHKGWLRRSARLACRQGGGSSQLRWLASPLPSRLVAWYLRLTHQSDCILLTATKPHFSP